MTKRAKENAVCLVTKWRQMGLTLTQAQYQEEVKRQRGLCAICGEPPMEKKPPRLHVDHEHWTNKFRGLLCGRCNRGLGLFKDSPLLLRAAALYVEGRPLLTFGGK